MAQACAIALTLVTSITRILPRPGVKCEAVRALILKAMLALLTLLVVALAYAVPQTRQI